MARCHRLVTRIWPLGLPAEQPRQTTPRVFLSEGKFEPHCFRGPGLRGLKRRALGLSVATCDDNLGPGGSDLDRHDLAQYHRDPRASHRRHRRPYLERCAPLGLWQRSSSRPYQMHSSASQHLACIEPRASRSQVPGCNCSARRSIQLCTMSAAGSVPHMCSTVASAKGCSPSPAIIL